MAEIIDIEAVVDNDLIILEIGFIDTRTTLKTIQKMHIKITREREHIVENFVARENLITEKVCHWDLKHMLEMVIQLIPSNFFKVLKVCIKMINIFDLEKTVVSPYL